MSMLPQTLLEALLPSKGSLTPLLFVQYGPTLGTHFYQIKCGKRDTAGLQGGLFIGNTAFSLSLSISLRAFSLVAHHVKGSPN